MREKFITLDGMMAPMPIANVNTDAIIPSPWLRFAHADLGRGLFGTQRFEADGTERPDFVLNRPPFRNARILLADENFGCGSSREAAVWALAQFGIRCVLAPGFADIFYENAFRNGVLAAVITPGALDALLAAIERNGAGRPSRIDLRVRQVVGPDGVAHGFQVPASRAEALMRGDDEIEATLRQASTINAFHARARVASPWLYPSGDQPPYSGQTLAPAGLE